MKLHLAWEFQEIDEAVLDRQDPAWLRHLTLMGKVRGQALADKPVTIAMPPGVRRPE